MTLKEGLMVKVTNTLKEDAKGLQPVYIHMMKMEGRCGVILRGPKYNGSFHSTLVKFNEFEYFLDESLVTVIPMYKEV